MARPFLPIDPNRGLHPLAADREILPFFTIDSEIARRRNDLLVSSFREASRLYYHQAPGEGEEDVPGYDDDEDDSDGEDDSDESDSDESDSSSDSDDDDDDDDRSLRSLASTSEDSTFSIEADSDGAPVRVYEDGLSAGSFDSDYSADEHDHEYHDIGGPGPLPTSRETSIFPFDYSNDDPPLTPPPPGSLSVDGTGDPNHRDRSRSRSNGYDPQVAAGRYDSSRRSSSADASFLWLVQEAEHTQELNRRRHQQEQRQEQQLQQQPHQPTPSYHRRATESELLEYLATGEFSSPSLPTLPPSPPHQTDGRTDDQRRDNMPPTRRRAVAPVATPPAVGTSTATATATATGSRRDQHLPTTPARRGPNYRPTVPPVPPPPPPPPPLPAAAATMAPSSTTSAGARRRESLASADGRTSTKRRRNGELVSQASNVSAASTAATAATGASGGTSSSNNSQNSQGSQGRQSRRPQISLKRPMRSETVVLDDDDLFGSDDDADVEVVNLTGMDRPSAAGSQQVDVKREGASQGSGSGSSSSGAAAAAPPLPGPPENVKRVKLATFQCVICMDDATNLTVTHCGHLFCGDCLHSSLHIDDTRRICPICRQKIEVRGSSTAAAKVARSYFPLELKLMTRNRRGKQPAQAS
ncbi:zinc finger, ring-type containing protein [Niveomyces insectorum RCEF 264]|uniref:Zinc finger, ring-type containing protein n=1 Tax=Niveomyces insectorum RCEF 264 TaxID=1081102 RepID=A0A167UYL7_9HYPO|nr:zinc finger, ring-type containing protein [Niveomyces insectorum RCEF 264]